MRKPEQTENIGRADEPIVGGSWLSIAAETLVPTGVWFHVLSEVHEYASLEAGWRGEGTLAVSERAKNDAAHLVRAFARESDEVPAPLVGADDDGCIVMTWNEADLIGSLSVYGDGTYAYYFRSGESVQKCANAQIREPISRDLATFIGAAVAR